MKFFAEMECGKTCHLPVDRKPQAADDDQKDGGEIDNGIFHITAKAVAAQKVDSGITESRYRMEDTVPDSCCPVLGDKNQKVTQSPQTFQEKGDFQNTHGQPYQTGKSVQIVSALDQHPVGERDPPPEDTQNDGSEGDDPKAAELDQKQENHLAERGKGLSDVYGGKSCHTYAGGGHKKGVDKADFSSRPQAYGQGEKESADQRAQKKAQHNDSCGGKSIMLDTKFFHVYSPDYFLHYTTVWEQEQGLEPNK